jgi:hypothetical protein
MKLPGLCSSFLRITVRENMEVHTSLLIFYLPTFLLLDWFVSLTFKYSVPGYGKNVFFCMHFKRIPCEIKETKNNNLSFYLYHLLLSCFHILYELALEQNADAIRCVFFLCPYGS